MIRVSCLSHNFGENEVLKGISLEVASREIVCVMGSSGGGKTTLLRCMAGLLRPTSGTVELFGKDFYGASESVQSEIRKQIGVVFQGSALFDYLNVRDNVIFGKVRQQKMSEPEQSALVRERLATVGLRDIETLMPSELSGGMKKRVGLARALASDPQLLFYDEPTSGLDPVSAYAIDALIDSVSKQTGATSVVVTHEVASAMRIGTRIVFLHGGEVIEDCTPAAFQRTSDERIIEVLEKSASRGIRS